MSEPVVFGQWIGKSFPDDGPPHISVVNIDSTRPDLGQVINAGETDGMWFRTVTSSTIKRDGNKTTGKLFNFQVFDPEKRELIPNHEFWLRHKLPGQPPHAGTYESTDEGEVTKGTYETNLGKRGRFELRRNTHRIKPIGDAPMGWKQFKDEISAIKDDDEVVYRGQSDNARPLRTLFHRCGRNNILSFLTWDVPTLRHQINAVSKHYYSTEEEDFLGLLSLAQHHGFPTPLLDWTRSPYVAAFFAFDAFASCSRWNETEQPKAVRIFIIREQNLPSEATGLLHDPLPQLNFVYPPAHNNPRYVPQQSVSLFCNVDNIEGFTAGFENEKTRFLWAIDIDSRDREIALRDLRLMGITSASLFPGFEGVCRSLRSQFFR